MDKIQKFIEKNKFIEDKFSYDKYNNTNVNLQLLNGETLFKIAIYFLLKENYFEMKRFFKVAIEKENVDSMRVYGRFLLWKEDNVKTAYRILLMAHSRGDKKSIIKLVEYFYKNRYQQEYIQEMIFSNILAIDSGYVKSMHYLGKYYEKIRNRYDKMEEYYLMAINNKEERSLSRLVRYYIYNKKYNEIYDLLKNLDSEFIKTISCSVVKKSIKIFNYSNTVKEGECVICMGTEYIKKPCHENHLVCITCLYNCKESYDVMRCSICRKDI